MGIKLEVDGIHCGSCASRITKAIRKIDLGARVSVDVTAGIVEVDAAVDRDKVVGAIKDAGYKLRSAA